MMLNIAVDRDCGLCKLYICKSFCTLEASTWYDCPCERRPLCSPRFHCQPFICLCASVRNCSCFFQTGNMICARPAAASLFEEIFRICLLKVKAVGWIWQEFWRQRFLRAPLFLSLSNTYYHQRGRQFPNSKKVQL